MSSLLSRFITNFIPNIWPFSNIKRAREELEENEENFDLSSSPPKRMRLSNPPPPSRFLREMNIPTVTTVKKRSDVMKKSTYGDIMIRRPIYKASSPPAIRWTGSFIVDDDDEIPASRSNSSRSSLKKDKRNPSITDSIDLTEDDPRDRAQSSTFPVIDITDDDNSSSVAKKSILGGNVEERKFMRPRTVSHKPRNSPASRSVGDRRFRSNNSSETDLLFNGSFKRRQRSKTIDLTERFNFGKLLGQYIAESQSIPTSPTSTSPPPATIDLTNEDDDVSSGRPGPSSFTFANKTTLSEPKRKDFDTVDLVGVSSATQKGLKKELMRVNSFEKKIKEHSFTDELWLQNLMNGYKATCEEFSTTKEKFEREAKLWDEANKKKIENLLEEKLTRHLKITESFIPEPPVDPYAPIIRPLPELTKEMLDVVKSTYAKGSTHEVVMHKYSYQIKRCDIVTLHNQNWLNDEVISFYLVLIEKRNESLSNYPKVYPFSTFFYGSLENRGYDGVKRWTRKVNIFEKDIIIMPIHLRVHWCLLIADLKKKEISYFDSMGGENSKCLYVVRDYLKAEHKTKMGTELDMSSWKIESKRDIPQQMNGSDCGVFTCCYAEHCSRRAPFDFNQSKMPYFRRRMIYEIMTGELL